MSGSTVRLARLQDQTAIAEFTRDTFEWGDYVAEAFPDWLKTPDAAVFVATDESEPAIAVSRVVQLSRHEVWLHGPRVQPPIPPPRSR